MHRTPARHVLFVAALGAALLAGDARASALPREARPSALPREARPSALPREARPSALPREARPSALPREARQEAAPPPATPAPEPPPLLDHQKLRLAMRRLETEHPDLVEVFALGTSRGDRAIEALRLMAGEQRPGSGRPAILLVANLDGTRVYESGIALDHAQRLARGYGTDEAITRLLDTTTVYVLPRANPDAAEVRFQKPLFEAPATGHGVDTDRDGREGEDAPADVDGDGVIEWMRVPDPEGLWMADPRDPRALIEADAVAGERGAWRLVPEGRDADRDEAVAEDPPRDAIVNRNFPHLFVEHAPESGLFPTDEPEARALADFLVERDDVALVLVYGDQDNVVEPPKGIPDDTPAVKRVPKPGVPESDAKLLAEIGKRYRELTGNATKGTGDERGSFQAWCAAHRGLPTLSISLWSLPEGEVAAAAPDAAPEDADPGEGSTGSPPDAGASTADGTEAAASATEGADAERNGEGQKADAERKPSADAKGLAWIDAHPDEAWRFRPWTPFEHPDLGAVEIGGFAPYARTEPPAATRTALAERHLEFLVSLGDLLPRVAIVECTAKDLGGGLLEVRAVVENAALLPLQLVAGRKSRTVRPARARIQLLAGGAKLVAGREIERVEELAGSGGRAELRWLVQGARPAEISVSIDTPNAGTDQATPEVKR